jgi:hypothetical protein
MGIWRHRRLRREETVPNDGESDQQGDPQNNNNNNNDDDYEGGDEDGNDGDDDHPSQSTTIPSSISLPSTSTDHQFGKAGAIGEEVIKKVPSK